MTQSIDLQVNGYVGVDFNSNDTTPEDYHRACESLRRDDVESILATVITDSIDNLATRLRRIVEAREQSPLVAEVVVGVHIEGPFLNPEPGYIGAHPAEHAQTASLDSMKTLIDAANGLTRIVTLAPECDEDSKVTRWLADQNVTVSAGHCNPTLDQLHAAIDAGLSMFTHLGERMSVTDAPPRQHYSARTSRIRPALRRIHCRWRPRSVSGPGQLSQCSR